MNQDLGTLYFSFKQRMEVWKSSLDEADRMYETYKRKWEKPIGLAMAGGRMAGASSGAATSVPNIVGTSNGDVTWRLSDAVDRHQARDDNAVAVARRMQQSVAKGDIDEGGGGGDVPRASRHGVRRGRSAIDKLAEFAERARAEAGVSSLSNNIYELKDYDLAPGKSYREKFGGESRVRAALDESSRRAGVLQQQQEIAEKLMEKNGATELSSDKSPGMLQKLMGTRVNIHQMLRSAAYGIVIDAAASMSASTADYNQQITLAGTNQGEHARAALNLRKSILGSVPIVGGLLNSFDRTDAAPIETQLELADRRVEFQNYRQSLASGTQATRQQSRAVGFGPASVSRGLAGNSADRILLKSQMDAESAAGRQKFDRAHPLPTSDAAAEMVLANPSRFGLPANLDQALINDESGTRNKIQAAIDSQLAEMEKSRRDRSNKFNDDLTASNTARFSLNDSNAEQIVRQGVYASRQTDAEVSRMQLQNQFRPVAGQARYITESTTNEVGFLTRPGASAADREISQSRGQLGIESLRGMQVEMANNIRYGSAREYNPYVESPLAFTDRASETMNDQWTEITTQLRELNTNLKAVFNYSGRSN